MAVRRTPATKRRRTPRVGGNARNQEAAVFTFVPEGEEEESFAIPPSPAVTLRGVSCTLADLDVYCRECRKLVDGMAVWEMWFDHDSYSALITLLRHYSHPAFAGTGLDLRWNEILIVEPGSSWPLTRYSFDLSKIPYRYCNQAGVVLRMLPPWADVASHVIGGDMHVSGAKERKIYVPQEDDE